MTLTARKHAWLHRIRPKTRQIMALCLLEIVAIASWTLLADTLFARISGNWFVLFPLGYIFSASLLAWLEQTGLTTGMLSPLKALGLAEIARSGRKPTQWQTLRRLLFTPPLTLLAGIGFIPVKRTTLLQRISGTRIVPLSDDMDPRSRREIRESRQRILMRVIAYVLISLMVSAVILLVPPLHRRQSTDHIDYSISMLPDEERELLAVYLDLSAIYPDSIEFHVRLASLYYRNNMMEDLANELLQVRRLDPSHPILFLEQDLSITIIDLQVQTDSTAEDSIRFIMHQPEEPSTDTVDSTSVDTLDLPEELDGDTVSLDLRLVSTDSVDQVPDTARILQPDTVPYVTVPLPPDTGSTAPPDSSTYMEPVLPDTNPPVTYGDTTVSEDTVSLPETPSVQETTGTDTGMDESDTTEPEPDTESDQPDTGDITPIESE